MNNARMRSAAGAALLSVVFSAGAMAAAPKNSEQPDKEMLRMMDLLKNMDMIKQIDLMQDMQNVDPAGEASAGSGAQKSQVVKKGEAAK